MENISGIIGLEAFFKEHLKRVNNMDVILEKDVARLFDITIPILYKTIKKNKTRFPEDFIVVITNEISKTETLGFSYAGISMLAGQLKSPKAERLSIQIIDFILSQKPNTGFGLLMKDF
jgi:hypothetical protein